MARILKSKLLHVSGIAFLCAIGLTLFLPALASAHSMHAISQGLLNTTSASTPGTLNGPTFFNFIAVTLVELAAIFWVGAQLWGNFVLQSSAEKHPEERELNTQIERRFERRFSLPTLVLLLLANLGVLYGQALTKAGNNWGAALSFQQLGEQASSGRFGTYWLLRMAIILLALLVGVYMLLSKQRPRAVNQALPLVNLFLGAVLFIAITMSGDATAVNGLLVPYSVVLDWLHLLAAALWIGGMFSIFLVYLPLLKPRSIDERTRSLLAILTQFSPLAIAGVVIMAVSGPLNASFHLTSIGQFTSTAYGRVLLIKVLLVCVLLATSTYHIGWLRPRLKKEYQKYLYIKERLEKLQANRGSTVAPQTLELTANSAATTSEKAIDTPAQISETRSGENTVDAPTQISEVLPGARKLLTQQVKLREERLVKKTGLMTRVLRWEPWLGVAVIVCVGLMNVFASTLTPTNTSPTLTNTPPISQQPGSTSSSSAFHGTAKTSDGKYSLTLSISPNRFGTNVFTVHVIDVQTGQALGANQASVTIYTTMLDMDMGTDSLPLQPDNKGNFSGSGELAMNGNWSIQVQIRSLDNTLHRTSFKIYAPF